MKFLKRINYILYSIQKVAVVVVFLALLGLSAAQVILRLAFHTGIPEADSIMRYMVMWVAFLGACLATYKGRHINLDVVSRSLKKLNKNVMKLLVSLASTIILGFLCYASVVFISNEIPDSQKVTYIPVWMLETIIVLMYAMMFLVYLQGIVDSIAAMTGNGRNKKKVKA